MKYSIKWRITQRIPSSLYNLSQDQRESVHSSKSDTFFDS